MRGMRCTGLICIGLASVAVVLAEVSSRYDVRICWDFALICFTGSLCMICAICVMAWRRRGPWGRMALAVILGVLGLFLIKMVPYAIALGLSYCYAPPAIGGEELRAYEKCIAFVEECSNHHSVFLRDNGVLKIGDCLYSVADSYRLVLGTSECALSEECLARARAAAEGLASIRCVKVSKEGNAVLFFTKGIALLPFLAIPLAPPRAGVLYWGDSDVPVDFDAENLAEYAPYTRLTENWYVSPKLILGGSRYDIVTERPKALIDRSFAMDALEETGDLSHESSE